MPGQVPQPTCFDFSSQTGTLSMACLSALKSLFRPTSRNARCPFPMTDYQRGMPGCCHKAMERRTRRVRWVCSAAWPEHQRGSWCPGRPALRPPAGPDWSPHSSSSLPWPPRTGWSAGKIPSHPSSGWDPGRLAFIGKDM